MGRLTKNRKEALSNYDLEKLHSVAEAADVIKQISKVKFDASVDMAVRLGVDPRKANQMVRGTVSLPHGTGKNVRVLVLCTPDKEQEAKDAGADHVGLDEFLTKIKGGWTDVDVIITTPNVRPGMPSLSLGGFRASTAASVFGFNHTTRLSPFLVLGSQI